LFFLPIINTRKLKRSAREAVSKLRELWILPAGSLRSDDSKGKYTSLAEDECAICAEDAGRGLLTHPSMSTHTHTHRLNTPYVTLCGHTYCYMRCGPDAARGG
jgi:peroxin-2